MFDTVHMLLVVAFLSFSSCVYTLSYLLRPDKHAALWHVSVQTLTHHQRRFIVRTIAMSAMGLFVAMISLIPSLTYIGQK